jgi:hypothetical protein
MLNTGRSADIKAILFTRVEARIVDTTKEKSETNLLMEYLPINFPSDVGAAAIHVELIRQLCWDESASSTASLFTNATQVYNLARL